MRQHSCSSKRLLHQQRRRKLLKLLLLLLLWPLAACQFMRRAVGALHAFCGRLLLVKQQLLLSLAQQPQPQQQEQGPAAQEQLQRTHWA
jgi:hypothetical protein